VAGSVVGSFILNMFTHKKDRDKKFALFVMGQSEKLSKTQQLVPHAKTRLELEQIILSFSAHIDTLAEFPFNKKINSKIINNFESIFIFADGVLQWYFGIYGTTMTMDTYSYIKQFEPTLHDLEKIKLWMNDIYKNLEN